MKKVMFVFCMLFIYYSGKTQNTVAFSNNKVTYYYTNILIGLKNDNKVKVNNALFRAVEKKRKKYFSFTFPSNGIAIANSPNVVVTKNEFKWHYNYENNKPYGVMINIANDSAKNSTHYSCYVHFIKENTWKLLGTYSQKDTFSYITQVYAPDTFFKKDSTIFFNKWYRQENGTWKKISSIYDIDTSAKYPALRPFLSVDSAAQQTIEEIIIKEKLKDTVQFKDGIYYTILNQGTGNYASLSDTIKIHYKGYLLSDCSIFDQTKTKPATFPLGRLIKGWQIGIPLIQVGGKIRLFIPSPIAYGIRSSSVSIPPNSTLVFDIDLLEINPPKE